MSLSNNAINFSAEMEKFTNKQNLFVWGIKKFHKFFFSRALWGNKFLFCVNVVKMTHVCEYRKLDQTSINHF
jgi:hypothetical protein